MLVLKFSLIIVITMSIKIIVIMLFAIIEQPYMLTR